MARTNHLTQSGFTRSVTDGFISDMKETITTAVEFVHVSAWARKKAQGSHLKHTPDDSKEFEISSRKTQGTRKIRSVSQTDKRE
jgi:hypothetical protein